MFLHLGRDVIVETNSIIALLDMDTATGSKKTREFLSVAEKKGRLFVVADELPKSAVVCIENGEQTVYICQISSKTLCKRIESKSDWDDFSRSFGG